MFMKKGLLFLISLLTISSVAISQGDDPNCLEKWQQILKKRGSYTVADNMHRRVIVSFIEGENAYCYLGKVRVENGKISSIFIKYKDDTYELFEKKFYNKEGKSPGVEGGISELIKTDDGENLKIVFIEQVKPEKKKYQQAPDPSEMLK